MLQDFQTIEDVKVWKNAYVDFSVDAEAGIARAAWKADTEDMTEEEYKEIFLRIAALIGEHNVRSWLGDARAFRYPVTPDLQDWFGAAVLPGLMEGGLEKMAMLMPEEFIAELSVEQSVEEIMLQNGGKFTIQYFDSLMRAENWLAE